MNVWLHKQAMTVAESGGMVPASLKARLTPACSLMRSREGPEPALGRMTQRLRG